MNTINQTADKSNEIRIATPGDFQEIFRICCLLHRENGLFDFSEKKVSDLIWRACHQDGAILGVIGTSDNIKAMIYLNIDEPYYSEHKTLVELWNYVRPDCRRSDFAKRMIKFAKKCTDETGMTLFIGIISDKQLEAKARLYSRLLPKRGTFFVYHPHGDTIDTRSERSTPREETRIHEGVV